MVAYPLWILPSWKVVPHQQLSAVLGYWLKNSGMVLGGQGTLRKTHLPRYSDLEEAEVKGDGTICLNCFASMPENSWTKPSSIQFSPNHYGTWLEIPCVCNRPSLISPGSFVPDGFERTKAKCPSFPIGGNSGLCSFRDLARRWESRWSVHGDWDWWLAVVLRLTPRGNEDPWSWGSTETRLSQASSGWELGWEEIQAATTTALTGFVRNSLGSTEKCQRATNL